MFAVIYIDHCTRLFAVKLLIEVVISLAYQVNYLL